MIRAYAASDKQKLLGIFKLNVPRYFAASELTDLDTYLEREAETYRVIEVDQKLVGGFGFIIDKEKSEGSITWIFFDPKKTGIGLGKLAIQYCHDVFNRTENIQKYTVRTSQLAYAFFEKFGYETTEIKKDYWGKGLDLYAMIKTL
jgi:ribosomal protein S18 acetylase RimI-like enzyme